MTRYLHSQQHTSSPNLSQHHTIQHLTASFSTSSQWRCSCFCIIIIPVCVSWLMVCLMFHGTTCMSHLACHIILCALLCSWCELLNDNKKLCVTSRIRGVYIIELLHTLEVRIWPYFPRRSRVKFGQYAPNGCVVMILSNDWSESYEGAAWNVFQFCEYAKLKYNIIINLK